MKLFKLTPVILFIGLILGMISTYVYMNYSWFLGVGGYLCTIGTGFLLFANQKTNI